MGFRDLGFKMYDYSLYCADLLVLVCYSIWFAAIYVGGRAFLQYVSVRRAQTTMMSGLK